MQQTGLEKREIQTQKSENGPLAHHVHKNQLKVTKGFKLEMWIYTITS